MLSVPMAPEDWIEKKFSFSLPIGAFPAVMERVRGTPARLEEMVRALPTEILTQRPGDAWSIQEHIGHLSDLEELHEARLDDFAAGQQVLRAADMTNRKTYEAQHNNRSIGDVLAEFRAARNHFVARLLVLDAEAIARSALHPRVQQPMRVIDLAIFVADHDDHHLAAIRHLAGLLAAG